MSFQELIKFLTQRLVQYIDTPASERQKRKEVRRLERGEWHVHWFGLLPTALYMLVLRPMREVLGKMLPLNKWIKA